MRWSHLLFCCLFLAVTFVAASTPLLASDLNSPRESRRDDGPRPGEVDEEERVEEFCYKQRMICRKVCDLRSRFEDRFDGCPSSCDSRETRCVATACFRWTEPDFLVAERFGAYKCAIVR